MTAGMNLQVRFTRLVYNFTDDDNGGANPTGTVLYDNIAGRIDEEPTNTAFLQQGLETKKIFSAMFWGHYLLFREQDEVEVISPPNHEYYGQKFRVVDRISSSNHPAQKRNVWIAKLERSQIAHKNPYQ
jgi:hypothetical protein